jgi:hypothetical protein
MVNECIKEMNKIFTGNKVNITKDKGRHDLHIRIQHLKVEHFLASKFQVQKIEMDTRYSSMFKTYFILFNNQIIPVVISDRKNTRSGASKILQKELTPSKLSIKGTYNSANELYENILNGLNKNIKTSFEDNDPLFLLLIKLANSIIDPNIELTDDEQILYSENANAINKDYGEALAALHLLNENYFNEITFSATESAEDFDIIGKTEKGLKKRVNIKSGGGSGQSFKSIYRQVKDILISDDFDEDSEYYRYSKVIKLLADKKGLNGKGRMLEAFNILKSGNGTISLAFKDVSRIFFNDSLIDINKLKTDIETFDEYKEIMENICDRFFPKRVGIPIGTKDKPASDVFNDKIKDKDIDYAIMDSLIFTLATWISNFTDNDVITDIMNELIVNKVYTFYVKCEKGNIVFEEVPTKVKYYKFHYWANFKKPTNNILGFKELK